MKLGNEIERDNNARIFFWDNIKFLLIVLVVIGHAIDYYTKESLQMRQIFIFIYIFHMPLFIFISGYFSKSIVNGKKFKIDKVFAYLILYLILKVSFFLMSKYLFKNSSVTLNFFIEDGVPWYLFAMSMWFCIAYIIRDIKYKYVITVSIILAMLVGYDKTVVDFLCISRIIVFFPYFILGYYSNEEDVMKILKCNKLKIVSIIVAVVTIIVIILYGDSVYRFRGFFTGRNPYIILKEPIYGSVYRMLFYGLSILISLAIMYLVPKKKLAITKLGARTLQVYFLHHIVLSIYNHYNVGMYISNIYPNNWKMIDVGFAIILTFILSSKIFEYPFKWVLGIKFNKIFIE